MAVRTRKDAHGRTRFDVEFMQRGRRVLERTPPGTTLAQARERETQLRREAYSVDTLGHAPELLLEEVIQGWLNTKPHKHHRNAVNKANQLLPFVKGRKVSEAVEVARLAITEWSARRTVAATWPIASGTGPSEAQSAWSAASFPETARPGATATPATFARGSTLKRGLSVATINRRLAILKAALTWHGREDLSRKIKLRRENNAREVYLTREQVKTLVKLSPTRPVGAAIMISAYSGLRAGELLILSQENITPSDGLMVAQSKSGKPRVIPTPSLLRRHLSALPLGLDYWQLHKGFSAARDAAGLGPEVTFHTLRHTYASWMINAGVDILTLSKLMGHSSVAVTQRYAHLYDKTLKDAVRKLR